MTTAAAPFESLDYLYIPAPDFERAVHFYTAALGGELRWRIHDAGTRVGAVRISPEGPSVLLANHLEPGHAVLIYRVAKLDEVRRRLEREGFTVEAPRLRFPRVRAWFFAIPEASGSRYTNECDRAWSGRSRDGSTLKADPKGPALR